MKALQRIAPEDAERLLSSVGDPRTHALAREIVQDVRREGDVAVRRHSERLGDLAPGVPIRYGKADLEEARRSLERGQVELLERAAKRIRVFAEAQKLALGALDVAVPGGRAGHDLLPVASAGCYAPGGRFPLPSSVLMTALTARVAGVERVVVASPKPATVTLAAAAVAGADELYAIGGAQAVAALAYGTQSIDRVDFLCGPGNAWVTAAKGLVFGAVGIDSLAGPSELVVLADAAADPRIVAADLLAQAEHDPEARAILVTSSNLLAEEVDRELALQLQALLPTCAAESLASRGAVILTRDLDQAVRVCDRLAPEHLELLVENPGEIRPLVKNCGALFIGERSAEVLGDYGAGPNHVLPTGGGARFRGGLSVLDFVRVRTWLDLNDVPEARLVAADARELARLEGLEAHARSAELRMS